MYGEHAHVLESLLGLDVVRFALEAEAGYRVDTGALLAEVRRTRPGLVVVVNPNSPTGQHWERSDVLRFLDGVPQETTILLDETYVEYAGFDQSVERDACRRANVLVLKSMSKVYALSGLRVGYLVGSPERVRELAKWMPPWAVSLPAQVAAVAALGDAAYYERRWAQTHRLREELARGVGKFPVRVFPSMANFVLVETPVSAELVRQRMESQDVFVRNCDSMSARFEDRFLRIAVKRRAQNRRIVQALGVALA
jgi:histidinol-phosphate/aromatic aminotransferase/cobyric acid decarboxylase-like protein